MHPLHFRYISDPTSHNCSRLFQLMDDMQPDGRHALLRDAFRSFNVRSPDAGTAKERAGHCYREFKERCKTLMEMLPEESPFVFGMVCFILGNGHARSTRRVFHFIERQREDADDDPSAKESLDFLREEEHQLRVAYREFCDLVIAGLVDENEPTDFGSEWLIDEDGPVDDDSPESDEADKAPSKKLFPDPEIVIPCHPAVTTFLDQVSAHFEKSLVESPHSIAVREGDKAVSISVSEYSAPTPAKPDCPLVLRLFIRGLTISDPRQFKKLGLRPFRRTWFEGRLEFSLFPNELALLATWAAEWIRGQVARDTNPPPIPIRLSGESRYFEFSGDPAEQSPFVEPVAEAARAAFSSEGTDWLKVDYLWSKAAREANNVWQQLQKGDDAEGGQ